SHVKNIKREKINVIIFKYNIQPRKYMQSVKNNNISLPVLILGESSVPRTDTDWVPTAAINQAPLIPSDNRGFFFRIVTDIKKVYITITHKNIPRTQSIKGSHSLSVTI